MGSSRTPAGVWLTVGARFGLSVAAATAWTLGLTGLLPVPFGAADTALAEHHLPVWLSLALLVTIGTVVAHVRGVAGAARVGGALVVGGIALARSGAEHRARTPVADAAQNAVT
ncbi:hypothetical protein [Nocardia sp. NPDC052112]|uniref:hypothetical protein n=1 Tax=Nocardia sp. NPDC052112 TaxID=3155646 RepID=UPI003427389B